MLFFFVPVPAHARRKCLAAGVCVTHTVLCCLFLSSYYSQPLLLQLASEISSNSEASEADPSIFEKMEKIVSDDANIADVASVEARDGEKKEEIEIEKAKEEISIPVEDKEGLQDSKASIAEDPVGTPEEEKIVQESIKDVSVETDDNAQELVDATVDANGVEPPVEAPKESAISETVAEEEKGVEKPSEVSGADSNPVELVSESIAQEPSQQTFVGEKTADEQVSINAVEVSPQIPKEELPIDGASDVVPSEPKEVQVETLTAEKNVEDLAEHVAKPELDAKKEIPEKDLDIAEGVEVSKDAKDENLGVQNSNSVELSRDIKMVEAENNVPSDNKQCESKELETELKTNKQTLLDTFEDENTEDKEQDTVRVGAGSLTETKANEEVTKAELSGKKPKTIISKVKQSIVKVKKALIGKSPSSKTMAPEGIDETKAK